MFNLNLPRLNSVTPLRYDGAQTKMSSGQVPQSSTPQPRTSGSADMEVTGPGSVNNINKLFPVKPVDTTQHHASSPPVSETDVVEISTAGKMIDKQHPTNDLRAQRIERIKIAIQDGTYDTQDKLEAALDKLLQDLTSPRSRKPD